MGDMPVRQAFMQIISKILIVVVLICIFCGCVFVWALGSFMTQPTNGTVPSPSAPARLIHIDSTQGIQLAGSYWPTDDTSSAAILLLHGNGSNRGAMTGTATWLHAHHYAVLAIDFRGHGESTQAGKSFGLFEADDARAAFAWLHTQHPNSRIGVFGYSLGGAASLIGKQGPLPADAFVLQGVYPDIRHAIYNRLASRFGPVIATLLEPFLSFQSIPRFGVWPAYMAPIRSVQKLHVPIMIIGGGNDINTPPAETRALYDAVKDHAELHILPNISHRELGSTIPPDLQARLLAFLDRNLNLNHD